MNILADKHHQDLANSLSLLFEKRLGNNLFFPIGMDWYTEGYWNIYPSEDTAKQYLDMRDIYLPPDGTLPLNQIGYSGDGTLLVEDKHNNTFHKSITLEQFKKMPIAIVIASIPAHIEPFKRLAQMKGAKFIFQAGNVFPEVQYNLLPNLMTNTMPPYPPQHTIQYHQEFDLNIYKPTSDVPQKQISSFINVYHANAGFEDFMTLKSMMPDFQFKSFGAQNQDGVLNTTEDIAHEIQKSYFVFHSKAMGDGYGYGLYCSFACGKPVITRFSDYKDKLGEELLEDDVTAIDLDKHSFQEVVDMIQNMSPDKYQYLCQQVYQRFQEKVDFDTEEVKIKEFIDTLR